MRSSGAGCNDLRCDEVIRLDGVNKSLAPLLVD